MEIKNVDLSSLKIDRSDHSPSSRRKWILIVFLILLVLLLSILFINPFRSTVEVKITSATKVSHSQSLAVLTASGYVVAQRKASVASKGTGRLVYLGVVEGDAVKKDQVIARLEDSDIKAQLEQANANLKLSLADLKDAENTYDRQKILFAEDISTKSAVDAAEARILRVKANIEVARAMVRAAEVALENTVITAPFDGTVLTKNANVGEILAPLAASASSRAAVVTIADLTSLEVEADVSESSIQKIKPDQPCEISLDAYPDIKYPGFVSKIVPTADRSKATVMVKVGFKTYDERVLPEMSAKVVFLSDETETQADQPMIVAPSPSVTGKDGKMFVFKILDDRAVKTEVTTGKTFGNYTEITDGLSDGDRIIETISGKIKEGVRIKETSGE